MAFLPIAVAFVLYFLGVPVAYALFSSGLFYFTFIDSTSPLDLILQKFITSTQSFPFLAIPFFIMAGIIMNYAGISKQLMNFADVLTGHLPGGLAQINVLLSMLMGGVSGSANADAAMQCKMLVPEMERRGYSKGFSAAITAASSAATPVIPPGIDLIIYALIAKVSVTKIFMAGYIPGILMSICLMVAVHIISRKRNYRPNRERRATGKEIIAQGKESIWALLFPFGIIIGLRLGVFTPSEAGAVAVFYCLLVGLFAYKEFKISYLPKVIRETVESTSTVVLIIVAADVFGYYMTWERIPQMITTAMLGITDNKYIMLMIINVLFLIMGMFIEGGAAMIIMVPILAPLVSKLGIDLVHFGLVCIVNIMIGGITPPFGSMMFTCCSITGCKLEEFMKEVFPFIIALVIALLIVTYIPGVVMFLPNILSS